MKTQRLSHCLGIAAFCLIFLGMAPDEVSLNGYFITRKPWLYNSTLEADSAGTWRKIPETVAKCQEDDLISFKYTAGSYFSGTYEITSGKLRCKSKPDVSHKGTWSISTNGRTMMMDDYELTVVKANRDTLQLIRGKGKHRDRYTFTHAP